MSWQQISELKFRDYMERDERDGVKGTPERRRFLREMADDFADQMDQDAAVERAHESRAEQPAEPDDEEDA